MGKFEKEDPAANLTAEQKNVQHAMVTMVENHLQWAIMHWRVKNADNTLKGFHLDLQNMMGTKMPVALLNLFFKHTMLRKGMKKVKAAGFNGYTPEEIEQFGKDDLKVLSELLGDKQFFFGDDPNHLDLVAFSQLALVLNVDDSENGVKCPLKEFINAECTNLVGHYNRMKDRAWGDHWDEAIGEKMELNPHIPKPDPPKEEEKVEEKKEEAEDKKEDAEDKKEEDKEKADSDEKEEKKKDLHKQQSASTLYIFPNDIVPPRSESVGHVDEATDELCDTLSVVTKSASSSDDRYQSSRYLNTTKKERDRGLSFRR